MQNISKKYNNLFKFVLTAILIFVPLFPKFPAFRIPGIYVAIRLEDFLIFGALVVFLIPLLSNIKNFLTDKLSRSILLFILVGFISLISGIYLTQTVAPTIGFLHWIRRVEYLSLFFIGYVYISHESRQSLFEYVVKVLLLVNFFIFLYGIGQHYLNFPVIITQNEEYSKGIALRWIPGAHINSTFGGHYDLASYLVLTIPIFVTAFFVFKNKLSKFILASSIASGFWLLSVAVSRISIVAFLIATTFSLFLMKKYKELLVFGLISVIAFGFSPDLRARYGRIYDVLKEKITFVTVAYAQEKEVFEDRSSSIRFVVEWPRALRAFYKNPILGTGYSSISLATDNDYLRALGETGILGLMVFLFVLFNVFKSLINYKFTDNLESAFTASILGSFVGILVTAVFIDIFEASKFATIFWLILGLTIGQMNKINLSTK